MASSTAQHQLEQACAEGGATACDDTQDLESPSDSDEGSSGSETSSAAENSTLASAPKGPPKVAMAAPRLEALDGPRWVASVSIIVYHFYGYAWGSCWTQFFFILSGFVLAYVEMARPASKAAKLSQFAYVRKRLGALYPTYVFAIVLVQFQIPGNAMDWATLPLHLLLMQAWLPITYLKSGTWRWVGTQWAEVAWFVSVLVIYWFLLRPAVRCIRDASLAQCLCMVTALWSWSVVISLVGDVYIARDLGCVQGARCYMSLAMPLIYQGVPGFLHVFLTGIVSARIFILTSMCDAVTGERPSAATERLALDKARAPAVFRYGVVLGYALYALVAGLGGRDLYESYRYFWHNGGIMPVMVLVLLGGSIGEDPIAKYIFQNKLFMVLGRISYAQYLLQFRIWFALDFYFSGSLTQKLLFPVVLLVCAFLTERFITRVYNDWQRSRTEKGERGVDDKALARLERLAGRCA